MKTIIIISANSLLSMCLAHLSGNLQNTKRTLDVSPVQSVTEGAVNFLPLL